MQLLGRLGADTTHLHAETQVILLEEWVVVSPSFWSTSDASEVPSIEFSRKACEFRLLVEKLGHDLVGKALLLKDYKPTAVRQPCYDIA